MAATNRQYSWKDEDRLFVDLDGATVEVQSLMLDRHVVTPQLHATVAARNAQGSGERGEAQRDFTDDPLLDECLW